MSTPSLLVMETCKQIVLELCPWLLPRVAFIATNKHQHIVKCHWHKFWTLTLNYCSPKTMLGRIHHNGPFSPWTMMFKSINWRTICLEIQQSENIEICKNNYKRPSRSHYWRRYLQIYAPKESNPRT
jgi:hypothetical protein